MYIWSVFCYDHILFTLFSISGIFSFAQEKQSNIISARVSSQYDPFHHVVWNSLLPRRRKWVRCDYTRDVNLISSCLYVTQLPLLKVSVNWASCWWVWSDLHNLQVLSSSAGIWAVKLNGAHCNVSLLRSGRARSMDETLPLVEEVFDTTTAGGCPTWNSRPCVHDGFICVKATNHDVLLSVFHNRQNVQLCIRLCLSRAHAYHIKSPADVKSFNLHIIKAVWNC